MADLKTVAHEAAEILETREADYGDMVASWDQIARRAEDLAAEDDPSSVRAVLVLIAMKEERRRNSPDNPDHARDLCGYWAIVQRLRERERERGRERVEAGGVMCELCEESLTRGAVVSTVTLCWPCRKRTDLGHLFAEASC